MNGRPVSWIVGVCAVLFDVDVGPKVEHLVPEDVLTPEEKQDVAFHAFPDSMSMELHARTTIRDSCFFFRVKRRGSPPESSSAQPESCSDAHIATSSPAPDRYLYGFVFCRQRQDASLRRGGEQLSVLVLSEHPLSSVLRPLSQAAGHMYFSQGKAALMQLHQEISMWPLPVSGPLLQLHAGHTNIQARLPSLQALPYPSTTLDPESHSRAASVDALYQLDAVADAASAQQAAALHATSSAPAPSAAPGPGSGNVPQPSQSHRPPGLPRTISLPARGHSGQSYVFAKAVPNTLGRQSSAESPHSGSESAAVQTAGSQGALNGASNAPGTDAQAGPRAGLAAEPGPDSVALALAMSSSSLGAQPAQPVQRRGSAGIDGQSSSAAAFGEVDVYTSLHAHLPRLWQVWEMMLLGKPLIIVGLSPADCCNATAALISLLAPLPFRPDFRPYLTIHDPSFKALSSGQMPSDEEPGGLPCLIGVTNPYFIKALSHWPNVLSVGQKEQSTWGTTAAGAAATGAILNPVKALTQRLRGAQSLLTSHSEALWSTYRPLLRADEVLLARLLKPQAGDVRSKLARIAAVNSEALRRHFHDLTLALLAPFSRYFELGADGLVPRWEPAAFLSGLSGVQQPAVLMDRLPRPADVIELYTRFIVSTNFRFWMELRQQPLLHLLAPEPLPVGVLLGPNGKHLQEVELVGMFFEGEVKLQELEAAAKSPAASTHVKGEVTRLRRHLAALFFGMSEDLQWTCISSPSRRQLLAALQAELNTEQQQQLQRMVARLK